MKFKISFEALFVLYNAILKCTSMAELNVWKKKKPSGTKSVTNWRYF